MIYVLTPKEMRAADAQASAGAGSDQLMREAGKRIAEFIRAPLPQGARVIAFAGPGNNGGDAFSALAELDEKFQRVVFACEAPDRSQARISAEERARAAGVETRPMPESPANARDAVDGAAVAIDALFGSNAHLPIGDRFRSVVEVLDARERTVLAIDTPSGIDALTGAIVEPAVRATATIALAAARPGLLLDPARGHIGQLWIADIGIGADILASHARSFAALDDAAFLVLLPQRPDDADKRTAGAPLIVAGSEQFPGAAVLCAHAAARAGAGYVTVATSQSGAAAIRAHLIEQVVIALDAAADPSDVVDDLLDIAKRNGSIGLGPGLGLDERTGEIVRELIARCELPIVADASALFHLSKHLEIARGRKIVITPHAGEFARISGLGTVAKERRVERLREFVDRTGITTLLKGRATLIYDGTTMHVNMTGSRALATAGSGDVLTGIIATLLAQGLAPVDAARVGAYWHGRAGSHVERRHAVGTVAGDLPGALADALPPLGGSDTGLRRLF